MTIMREMPALPRRARVATVPENRAWRRQANVVFMLSLVLQLSVAIWLALDVGYLLSDALSRTQGALSAVASRFPELSSIISRNPDLATIAAHDGEVSVSSFAFAPLSTILQIPLLMLAPLLPELTRAGLAGAIVSALFMAGASREMWLIARERNVRNWVAVCGVLLFALNPMILLYGAVGMSEAPFIFATLWATRRLIRWTSTDDVHDLIVAGLALALAYLARYDALVMALVAALGVGVLTWRTRYRRNFGDRFGFAVLDMLVLLWPLALIFVTWSVAGWLTTGELFAQFTSGTPTSPVDAGGLQRISDASARALFIAPGLCVMLIIAVLLALRRRDPEPIFPLLLMLSVLFFQVLSHALGETFGLLRYSIIAIPLAIVLFFQISPPGGSLPTSRPGVLHRDRAEDREIPTITSLLIVAGLVLSNIGTGATMTSRTWAPQEFALQQAPLWSGAGTTVEREIQARVLNNFHTEAAIADYLDSLNLGEGEVLLPTNLGFAVLTASGNQKQFVIPSDRDFIISLNQPVETGVRYILTAGDVINGVEDPISLRYPGIHETGAGIATLEAEFLNDGYGLPNWRLYRVPSSPLHNDSQ